LPNFAVRSFHFISANSLRLIKVSKIWSSNNIL
jgi:hypothetical protein